MFVLLQEYAYFRVFSVLHDGHNLICRSGNSGDTLPLICPGCSHMLSIMTHCGTHGSQFIKHLIYNDLLIAEKQASPFYVRRIKSMRPNENLRDHG